MSTANLKKAIDAFPEFQRRSIAEIAQQEKFKAQHGEYPPCESSDNVLDIWYDARKRLGLANHINGLLDDFSAPLNSFEENMEDHWGEQELHKIFPSVKWSDMESVGHFVRTMYKYTNIE